jgi:hypothetical protein
MRVPENGRRDPRMSHHESRGHVGERKRSLFGQRNQLLYCVQITLVRHLFPEVFHADPIGQGSGR